ncbi:recombinase family protein [uncultured Parasphingopyxis sp.]|uniref:recombinase family protein n=1 Tax=uncultured Parasphingopyxis sp. TaxID=1547918 RepID=UPI00262472B8|nr:recombinase family protein [uncultured Parasphingopyxis sp.]
MQRPLIEPDAKLRELRCAIYTRKSTEDGLEQDFNGLHAQREACEAYIASQRHEGWALHPELYDDGGFSGGNMERPGLVQLLADIRAGKIHVVVVYKVDRLMRSLADFAKIVEIMDGAGASFVSVTQSFNTTTSMGRLTLNVLLSFAQFEREVTGERIRDKIAASKKKGMWMGGTVPFGYRVADRKLHIEPDEAVTVRHIFARYLELGSVPVLADELKDAGVRTRRRISRNGNPYGGAILGRGALYAMLQNRIYAGDIVHKGKAWPGQHQAIIDDDLFAKVQDRLARNRVARKHGHHASAPSLLTGLVYDGLCRRMSPDHACKGKRRYRYYRSRQDSDEERAHPGGYRRSTWKRLWSGGCASSLQTTVSCRQPFQTPMPASSNRSLPMQPIGLQIWMGIIPCGVHGSMRWSIGSPSNRIGSISRSRSLLTR